MGRCGCLAGLDVRRPSRSVARTWAEQREHNLGVLRGLVEQGRAHGILVYDAGTPVGWCQFGPKNELARALRRRDCTDDAVAWRVTCFVAEPSHRGRGVPAVALRAALKAIGGKGGGSVEGDPSAVALGPPPKGRRGIYREGDVAFYGGSGWIRFGVEVEGVGPVAAMYRRGARTYGGTADLFQREGFEAVEVLPRPMSPRAGLLSPDRIVMRRTV